MNLRIPIVATVVALTGILINHFLIDWNGVTENRIARHFDQLIEDQRKDLIDWRKEGDRSTRFQKRIFCADTVTEWSDNHPWVIGTDIPDLTVIYNENGFFLAQKIQGETECTSYSTYPLIGRFEISNKYLNSTKNSSLPKRFLSLSMDRGTHQYMELFYYEIDPSPSRVVDLIFVSMGVLSLLIIFWITLSNAFYVVVGVAALVRLLTLLFGVLESLIRYSLFDPLHFTWSLWNPTLGDLFLNCILLFMVTVKWSRGFRTKEQWPSGRMLYPVAFLYQFVSVSIFWVLWRILTNSQVSLDVGKSIEFDILRVVSYLCVILQIGSTFLFSFRLTGFIRRSQPTLYFYLIVMLSTSFFAFVSLTSVLVALIFVLTVIVLSQLNWGNRLREFKYNNLLFTLVISIVSAGTLAFSVYKFHEESELDAKKKFANHLLIKRDVLGEYYLNQVMTEARQKYAVNSSRSEQIEEINVQLLNPYFDKYQVEMIDSLEKPSLYRDMYSLLSSKNLSDYQDIYFLDEGNEFKYICALEGVVISLGLKRRVPSSVFPALLTDSKYFTPSDDFDYAVFSGGEILFQRSKFGQGEWPEGDDFENEKLYENGIEKNARHYYGVETRDGRVILIISKKYSRRMQLTNFSFFFLIVLFFLGSIVLLSSYNFKEARLNFTGKIQLYLGLAFITPLFTSGFALLNSLNDSYREEINRNYLKRALYISELLSDEMESPADINSAKLARIRDFTQSDISFYNSSGVLQATSQNEVFDLRLQSDRINPVVFTELIAKENQSMIAEESIGQLSYKVSYATLNSRADKVVGFIAMPFFDSKNHLKRQQLEIFGSLVTIFGFIFIIATLFGNLVLNNLMKPLRMVADKIRQITLQEENKPILYESSDEIGSLVRDYNSMLVKLEQSKSALARSQKETAWKEIARQVAHEIKNPLTPMQLKIQQLIRRHEEGSKEYETLSGLLIQVDTLSQIAGSFSAFAEMPAPENTEFDFSKLVRQVAGLYHSEDVKINLEIEEDVIVHADKDIFQRILNNIVLNAIQSVDKKPAIINISLVIRPGKCELSVSDNGKGIADELKDKIFLNYFSTKSSGSGIGLALAKKGIENAGGNIWFESKENEGTTFFISMPLASS
ncbi:MAG: HAMP domain-containing sensor histidine kinase [Cyclobacteriaceae bacterium]